MSAGLDPMTAELAIWPVGARLQVNSMRHLALSRSSYVGLSSFMIGYSISKAVIGELIDEFAPTRRAIYSR